MTSSTAHQDVSAEAKPFACNEQSGYRLHPRLIPVTPAGWHSRVWGLAAPIILSNMSVPLVGAVDTAVVGHLPDPVYIGAVALGAVIFSFLYWGFGFLRMGTTGFVAQSFGAGNVLEVGRVLLRALLVAAALGAALVILQHPVGLLCFWVLQGGAELESLAADYYQVRIWSAPAVLANYAILGCLIGLHNTRAALMLQLVLNLTNVCLDLLFVLQFQWGVQGVAAASVVSEYTALAAGLGILQYNLRRIGARLVRQDILNRDKISALLQVNFNIFVRTLCLVFAFAYFTARGTQFGETVLAANAVLLHFQHLLAFGLDGFAHAAEALTGSAYGARDRKAFRSAVFYTTLWAALLAGIYTLVYAALGGQLTQVLTGIDSVQNTVAEYMPWILLLPLISVWSFQLDGVFIGTTRTVEMRNAMLVSLVVYLATVWLTVPIWGNHGLWLSLSIFMVARALTLGLKLRAISESLP